MQAINNYLVKCFCEVFKPKGKILEVGSFVVPGQEKLMDIRRYFPGCTYIGCDMRPGVGVDLIENAERFTFKDETFDCVICLDTFEHIENIFKASKEIYRILKPKGILVLSSVMNCPVHDFPYDYWRFTPKAFEFLTQKFAMQFIGYYGVSEFPRNIYAVAIKNTDNFNKRILTDKLNNFKHMFEKYKENKIKDKVQFLFSSIKYFLLPKKKSFSIVKDKYVINRKG